MIEKTNNYIYSVEMTEAQRRVIVSAVRLYLEQPMNKPPFLSKEFYEECLMLLAMAEELPDEESAYPQSIHGWAY